jgi:hypothetical protein
MNVELEKTWKKAVVTYFKVLSTPLPRDTNDSHKILQSWVPFSGLKLDLIMKQGC